MQRSYLGSGRDQAHGGPAHARPPRRTARRRGWVIGLTLATTLVLLSASAYAEPSERQLRAKIDKLTNKAEIITEKYNGQRIELKKAKKQLRHARQHSKQVHKRFQRAHKEIAQLAATQYKTGGMRRPWAIMAAKSPQDFIERATMMAHLSARKSAHLKELASTVNESDRAKNNAEEKADKVKRLTTDLKKKKDRIEDLIAEAKANLEELEEEAASRSYDRAPIDPDVGSGTVAEAVEIALAQQGDPYVWAADGPDAFDCSGLIVYSFGQVGIELPHYTGALWNAGPHIPRSQLQLGDLVFTSSHHVGIYVGDGQFLHAPNSGEVVRVDDIYAFYGAVRVA